MIMTIEPTNIVTVQYESRLEPGVFVGREYSYFTDIPLAVGDIVKTPTKYGTSCAKIARIHVPEIEVAKFKDVMRHITEKAKMLKPDCDALPKVHPIKQCTLFEQEVTQ